MYYHFLGGTITKTNFDLILSSPHDDDECFQIIILFLVSAQYIYVSSSPKNRTTGHNPDSQVVS